MVAAAAAVLNAAKTIAGIDDEKYVIAPNVFRDIQDLKANILKHDRTSLNVEEILTALSISAERNPCAQLACRQLEGLSGCKAHCTAILSDRDEQTLRSMGIDVTCDPGIRYYKSILRVIYKAAALAGAQPFEQEKTWRKK